MSDYRYKLEVPVLARRVEVWEVVAASEEEALQNWKSGSARFNFEIPKSEAYGVPVLTALDPPEVSNQ